MAHVFRQKYTKPIPAGATIQVRNGVGSVSWISRGGRKIRWPLSPDNPDRYVGTSAIFSVRWKGADGSWHVEHVSTVRAIAERRRLEIEEREERVRHGVLPASVSRVAATDASKLLAEWERAVIDGGASPQHADLYRRRAGLVLQHTGAGLPGKLVAGEVTALLGEWRRMGIERDHGRGRPLSVETSNHYLTAAKALTRWCIERGYLERDPLAGCRKLNADRARTFERRALTPDELDRLVTATAARTSRAAVPGPDRAVAYLVVAYTGLRLRELSQLAPESFRLDDRPPVVRLAASKGKPPAAQVLPEALIARLREYLADKPAGVPVWYGEQWAKERRASSILRSDLKAAGIPERDATGRVVNFHSLRTTFGTWLARAGVPIQHAQKLMRHSDPKITAAFYTKLGDDDLAGQLDRLPAPK